MSNPCNRGASLLEIVDRGVETLTVLFAPDTSPEARAVVLARLRAMTPAERFAATADLVSVGLDLARRDPSGAVPKDPTAPECRARFLERWLGRPLALAVLAYEEQRRSDAAR
jgi:hypothetical protein